MKTLQLNLTALEPLVITAGSAESMAHNCLDYVPGNMLLGAFAALWIHTHPDCDPDENPEFRQMFLDGGISWGCAAPVVNGRACIPAPRCFAREKREGNPPVCGQSTEYDEIFNRLAPAGESERRWREARGKDEKEKPRFRNFTPFFISRNSFCRPDLYKEWNTRVALEHERSAREGQLFGFSALARGTRLQAEILCKTSEAEAGLISLLKEAGHIHVGHARSSGYGRVALDFRWLDADEPKKINGPVLNIYLQSAYFPDPPWEDPLKNLLAKLEEQAGCAVEALQTFLSWRRVDGYCGHWHMPRPSRQGLEGGSVLQIRLGEDKSLPAAMELGEGRHEGYGRILVQPDFLDLPVLHAECGQLGEKAKPVQPDLSSPVWRLLRKRALSRLALKQAEDWLHHKRWLAFLDSAARLSSPGSSQRANALDMDKQAFEKMLGKSSGPKWHEAIAENPFAERGTEHLDEIMKKLLDFSTFIREFPIVSSLSLPGGELPDSARASFGMEAHGIFKRELGRAWGKRSRSENTKKV